MDRSVPTSRNYVRTDINSFEMAGRYRNDKLYPAAGRTGPKSFIQWQVGQD
jgi:hypothetical protein